MSVTSVDTDYDGLSVTVVSDFDAPVERVWELWSDPRKLERWWGPPTLPATFEKHDLTPGGEVAYTRMEMRSSFESREDLEKWLRTGTPEGQRDAIAQMDALLEA